MNLAVFTSWGSLLRMTLAVTLAWNCVLPASLFACSCTGQLRLRPADGTCESCAAKSVAGKSCCQTSGTNRSCCRHDGPEKSTPTACERNCCVELQTGKIPVVSISKATDLQDSFAFVAALPSETLSPVVATPTTFSSLPPPDSPSRQVLFCVWRN